MIPYKQPISVLVVIYTTPIEATRHSTQPVNNPIQIAASATGSEQLLDFEILLLERADHPGYWQSVTGSREAQEALEQTAAREVREETGIDVTHHTLRDCQVENHYEIYPQWRHRYGPAVTHNTEHVYTLKMSRHVAITLSPKEHLRFGWWPWREAAEMVFSPSNREAILSLAARESRADGRLKEW